MRPAVVMSRAHFCSLCWEATIYQASHGGTNWLRHNHEFRRRRPIEKGRYVSDGHDQVDDQHDGLLAAQLAVLYLAMQPRTARPQFGQGVCNFAQRTIRAASGSISSPQMPYSGVREPAVLPCADHITLMHRSLCLHEHVAECKRKCS